MGFNTYGYKKKTINGGIPVWLRVVGKEISGGKLEKLPPIGSVLPAGTLVSIERAGGLAKVLNTFEVASNVTAEATEIKIVAASGMPKPAVGTFIMKAPASVSTKGKGIAVTTVTENSDGTISIAIEANALGTLSKGDILVEATAAGASVTIYCIPTGLTQDDVYVDEGDTAATIASVYSGQIMEDRIQPIPDCVKAVLSQIKFEKGV